jgi:hypothetical protein
LNKGQTNQILWQNPMTLHLAEQWALLVNKYIGECLLGACFVVVSPLTLKCQRIYKHIEKLTKLVCLDIQEFNKLCLGDEPRQKSTKKCETPDRILLVLSPGLTTTCLVRAWIKHGRSCC